MLCKAQPQKDSLLLADASQVRDTIEIMFYLQKHAGDYALLTKEEQRLSNLNFDKFYEEEVKGNNPVATIEIDGLLKLGRLGAINDREEFGSRVFTRIVEVLIETINKYGFPSEKRFPGGLKSAHNTPVYVTFFDDKHDKELKRLLKMEYDLGNIEEKDYNMATYLLKRKNGPPTEKEMKWLAKNTNVKFQREPN